MTLDPKIKIKIKVKGDLNIGQPTPPPIPALPPANSLQIGNSLNGSENWGTSDNMDGWGIEHETKPEKKEELPKEVDTTTPEAAKPEREEKPENNIFRAVNQFTVEYTNNGQVETRRPDILLFVNALYNIL